MEAVQCPLANRSRARYQDWVSHFYVWVAACSTERMNDKFELRFMAGCCPMRKAVVDPLQPFGSLCPQRPFSKSIRHSFTTYTFRPSAIPVV
jgi:hypothetical protein